MLKRPEVIISVLFISITLMRYTAAGWRVKARGMLGIASGKRVACSRGGGGGGRACRIGSRTGESGKGSAQAE